jgi:hypothetical protein
MPEHLNHLASAKANDIPFASNLNTDSNVSELKSESWPFSSPHLNFEAEEKSTESISPGPPISIQSESTKSIHPAKPSDSIQEDSIRTETIASVSAQPLSISNASSFDDSMFISICHFYGLEHAKNKAIQKGWKLSKSPESLLEDKVQRRADWYRIGMVRGFAVLSSEQKASITNSLEQRSPTHLR